MPLTRGAPSLYYETRGTGEPLLLINGFGLSQSLLAPLVSADAHRVRWITYDHPGVGRSARGGAPCTVAALADCTLSVLDELGLETAHVAGLSLGGAIALELALRVPERLRSLILLGTTAGGPLRRGTSAGGLVALGAQVAYGSIRRRRLWLGPALYSPAYLAGRREARRHLRAVPVDQPGPSLRALVGQSVAASRHDRSRRLGEIATPTLVLHGEQDALLPVGNARRLADGIDGAELHVIPRTGHAFLLERPDEILALLADWVTRQEQGVHGSPP